MLQEGEIDHGNSNNQCMQGKPQAELQAGSLNLKKGRCKRLQDPVHSFSSWHWLPVVQVDYPIVFLTCLGTFDLSEEAICSLIETQRRQGAQSCCGLPLSLFLSSLLPPLSSSLFLSLSPSLPTCTLMCTKTQRSKQFQGVKFSKVIIYLAFFRDRVS